MRAPKLFNSALVPVRNDDDGQNVDYNKSQSKFVVSANKIRRKASTFQEITTHSLPLVRQKLISSNLSSEAQNITLSSWRPTTQKKYQSYLNRWTQYYKKKTVSFNSNHRINIQVFPNKIRIPSHQTTTPRKQQAPLELISCPTDPQLCIVTTLPHYLEHTKSLRGKHLKDSGFSSFFT